jgi:hypothetical protein
MAFRGPRRAQARLQRFPALHLLLQLLVPSQLLHCRAADHGGFLLLVIKKGYGTGGSRQHLRSVPCAVLL